MKPVVKLWWDGTKLEIQLRKFSLGESWIGAVGGTLRDEILKPIYRIHCECFGHQYKAYCDPENDIHEVWCQRCGDVFPFIEE